MIHHWGLARQDRTGRAGHAARRRISVPVIAGVIFALSLLLAQAVHAMPPAAPYHEGIVVKDVETDNLTARVKIIGGTAVESVTDFPFMAVIRGRYLCGGTMIAPQKLLTAAHCVRGTSASSWTATTYRLTLSGDMASDIVYNVSRIHIHPDYGSFTKGNDVAVMILGSPGPNDGTHRPAFVELNREDSVPTDGDQVTAIGWGTTSSGGTVSEQLMQVELPYIPTAQCMTTNWGFGSYASSVNYASMLCAGSPGKDTCQGDSGGPIMLVRNGKWLQVGITSWGRGCSVNPGVYARVSNVAPWVDGIVAQEGGYGDVGGIGTTGTSGTTETPTLTETAILSTATYCATPSLAIQDSVGIDVPVTTTSDMTVPADAPLIAKLHVRVKFNHTFPRDLTGRVQKVGSTDDVRLFGLQFCTAPKTVNAVFDDGATLANTCQTNGLEARLKPNQPLSRFAGIPANGTWRLTMVDNYIRDSGFLHEWCLVVSFVAGASTLPSTTSVSMQTGCPMPAPITVVSTVSTVLTRTATVTSVSVFTKTQFGEQIESAPSGFVNESGSTTTKTKTKPSSAAVEVVPLVFMVAVVFAIGGVLA